ncbi:hypothetical protein LXA43DRAFT_871438, partial [Ganoderma leucocontextum]
QCTSGVDPLSRRALWRTLSAVRNDRTVVFTTHLLDEADLLADTIAVLEAPGKLVAHGTHVALKSTLADGYTVHVSFIPEEKEKSVRTAEGELLEQIHSIAPLAYTSSSGPNEVAYHLKLKDPSTVRRVLKLVEDNRDHHGVVNYSVVGTSIEDIFLGLKHDGTGSEDRSKDKEVEKAGSSAVPSLIHTPSPTAVLELTDGQRCSPFGQALTIFHKCLPLSRRSWLSPTLAVLVAVAGSCTPIFFL